MIPTPNSDSSLLRKKKYCFLSANNLASNLVRNATFSHFFPKVGFFQNTVNILEAVKSVKHPKTNSCHILQSSPVTGVPEGTTPHLSSRDSPIALIESQILRIKKRYSNSIAGYLLSLEATKTPH